MSSLVLVGGTGKLGTEIAKGLVSAEGFSKFVALVRPESTGKAQNLSNLGWEIHPVDFEDTVALEAALKDTKVVVSTFSGPDIARLETTMMDASKKAGVSLYVPSQFGVDYRRWKGDFPFLRSKREVLAHAKEIDLPVLSVFIGAFSDVIFYFLTDLENMTAKTVGGGKAQYSFTRRSDIGLVLAKALADEKYYRGEGGVLAMQGDCMSWNDALRFVEKTVGKTFTITDLDPQDALKQEQELLAKGDMASFYGAFALHLLGEPARGSEGFRMVDDINTYGVKMESLETTLKSTLGASSSD